MGKKMRSRILPNTVAFRAYERDEFRVSYLDYLVGLYRLVDLAYRACDDVALYGPGKRAFITPASDVVKRRGNWFLVRGDWISVQQKVLADPFQGFAHTFMRQAEYPGEDNIP